MENNLAEKSIKARPDWDTWFMSMAHLVATRSLDTSTKHGCVVIDKDHTVLSLGYNSPPRGCNDIGMPMERPEKYKIMIHSEINAIINAARTGVSLNKSIFYITGYPCVDCFRSILNVGATEIVYGNRQSHCISENDKKTILMLNCGQRLKIREFVHNEKLKPFFNNIINSL